MDALNKRARKPRAYTTYMTIMARLHTKGVLDRRRVGRPTSTRRSSTTSSWRRAGRSPRACRPYGDVALSHAPGRSRARSGRAVGAAAVVRNCSARRPGSSTSGWASDRSRTTSSQRGARLQEIAATRASEHTQTARAAKSGPRYHSLRRGGKKPPKLAGSAGRPVRRPGSERALRRALARRRTARKRRHAPTTARTSARRPPRLVTRAVVEDVRAI
jgi:hypothetical protein